MKKQKKIRYFKCLVMDTDSGYLGGPYSGFDYTDYLPRGNKPGKWLPKVENLGMCASGYHAFEPHDLGSWCQDALFEVELSGKIIRGDDKVVAQGMRFLRRIKKWKHEKFDVWSDKRFVILLKRYDDGDKAERELEKEVEKYLFRLLSK